MAETRRPVFFSGENPAMSLYLPGTEQLIAVASYWHCTDSPSGVGHALVLWQDTAQTPASGIGPGAIFTDNLELAQLLVTNLTQHFPEFAEVPVQTLDYKQANLEHTYNGNAYRVLCQAGPTRIELEWAEVLDRKQIIWKGFPAGETSYDLTTIICPCRLAHISIDGQATGGEVITVPTATGQLASTAFLAFAESWVGPLDAKESGN